MTKFITKTWLKNCKAESDFRTWFQVVFPQGGPYFAVLARLGEATLDCSDWACWLMSEVGPDLTATLELRDYIGAASLYYPGHVKCNNLGVEGCVHIGGELRATEDIAAGGDISAGGPIIAKSLTSRGCISTRAGINVRTEIRAAKNITAGGRLRAGTDIIAGRNIKAGRDISATQTVEATKGSVISLRSIGVSGHLIAKYGVYANQGIKVGRTIRVGGILRAGAGYPIFAGIHERVTEWHLLGTVEAKEYPANLISGHWIGPAPVFKPERVRSIIMGGVDELQK